MILTWIENGRLQDLELDVTVSERHARESDVAEDPVEEGIAESDNVQVKSRMLQADVFVSNTPTPDFTDNGRAKRVLETLEGLQERGVRLDVAVGGKGDGFGRFFTSMVVASISVTRLARESNGLTISLVFREVRVASSEIAPLQVAKEPKGQKKVNTGDQKATPTKRDESLVSEGIDRIKRVFQ